MAEPYVYVPQKWLDTIIEMDEQGNIVYEKDEDGNIKYLKDHLGRYILDPFTNKPIPKPKYSQEGTTHSAARENYQEQGIEMAHKRLDSHENRMLRLEINAEIDGKAPGNSGTFADPFDGDPVKLQRINTSATITTAVSIGATSLPVDNVTGLLPFTQVTVFDGTNSEDVMITAVGSNSITVEALKKAYVKGAKVARSTTQIIDGKVSSGKWGTSSIGPVEVI
ncbi:hypothetical protein NCCP2222_01750 [Sporosarcina sp. NCCP-2222]|uniref:hypothetical protein n=1 Tax=Sporosarcina sp. NCCP-2222 TaxID=2935073 RepID=UPI00207EC04B|nr:hypothetical protein [Sporosarcina sp. NCCP-2222]GKV54228.1 hypothetical protein NCCP2222_01750 [Sporosarcina sp. NCCP-2222]